MRYWLPVIITGSLNIAAAAYASDSRCAASIDRVQPNTGVIGSQTIAEAVAFAYLTPIYGEAAIRSEMPFRVSLSDGIWTVNGTLPPGRAGGTAEIRLCQRNGTVLSIIHYK
jgi:hypothetical protein